MKKPRHNAHKTTKAMSIEKMYTKNECVQNNRTIEYKQYWKICQKIYDTLIPSNKFYQWYLQNNAKQYEKSIHWKSNKIKI